MSWQNDLRSQPVKLCTSWEWKMLANFSGIFWHMSVERNMLAFRAFSVFGNSNEGIEISQLFCRFRADKWICYLFFFFFFPWRELFRSRNNQQNWQSTNEPSNMVTELNSWRHIAPRLKAYFTNLLQKRIQLLSWIFYFDIIFNPSCGLEINPSCILKMQGETVSKCF